MIVPLYWSESKIKKSVDGKQFTLMRLGWSDISELDAKNHANTRLGEAVETLDKEGDVRRIDHKHFYNGAEGIPIREEVVSKLQDIVISRNSYGALCLNTPDVLFADIDFENNASRKLNIISFISLAVGACVVAQLFQSWIVFFISMLVAIIYTSSLADSLHDIAIRLRGGAEKITIDLVRKFSEKYPDLHIRLYRTPMGCRVLLMNDLYQPGSTEAINILESLKSDKTYIQMCRNQNCFRARVSPKPWRIGISRLKPRPGVWPIKPERLPDRAVWIKTYSVKAEEYSSCHYLLHLGSHAVLDKTETVRKLHDDMCKATSKNLRIA